MGAGSFTKKKPENKTFAANTLDVPRVKVTKNSLQTLINFRRILNYFSK